MEKAETSTFRYDLTHYLNHDLQVHFKVKHGGDLNYEVNVKVKFLNRALYTYCVIEKDAKFAFDG